MIKAGEYNKYVTLSRISTTQGSDGSSSESLTTLGSVWAKIKPLTGREYFSAQQTQGELTHNIICRYTAVGLLVRDVVVYGSRTFDIQEIVNVNEGNEEMILRCKERL